MAPTIRPPLIGNPSTLLAAVAGRRDAMVIAPVFKVAVIGGLTMIVVLLPITAVLLSITVDPDFAVDVVLAVVVRLEAARLVGVVLLPAAALLFELPPHATARSATAAIAPSAGTRRRLERIRRASFSLGNKFSPKYDNEGIWRVCDSAKARITSNERAGGGLLLEP